ncbi:hypothetical protein CCO03_08660 [Comamonas serinivorans]|uniref:Uncharacterized protein n=1 Tax=Comamonas serinivorans TaxID=1082851 RepID=A0A1Y0EMU8_9BURK|nr:hypothetical protein [Comamonas serinivorans]ARU04738.1 hypothetical protein CCO03_08660 [Comamonas serinivorans]
MNTTKEKRAAVDFGKVHESHRAIDKRLTNWAKWCGRDVATIGTSPMFRLMPRVGRAEAGVPVAIDADQVDATRIAAGVAKLPERHRHVLSWCYIKPSSPVRMAKALGLSTDGLWTLLTAARQLLLNQGV